MAGAGARIEPEVIEIGEKVYLRGIPTGVEPSGWESLRRTRVFLKAPITTPQGGGYKSLNVTTPEELGALLHPLAGDGVKLGSISNRGIEVWPGGFPETFCTDHWRCRFLADGAPTVQHEQIASLLARIGPAGLDFIKTENLCSFDGQKAYSGAD